MVYRIFAGIPKETLKLYGRTIAGNLEFIWQYPLSEFRSKRTKKVVCANRFHHSLYASMVAYMNLEFMAFNKFACFI